MNDQLQTSSMNAARNFFKKNTEKVSEFFREDAAHQTGEDIHHLRVAVKKMKALLALAKLAGQKKKIKDQWEPVDRLFTKAGKLRDLQLRRRRILEEYPGTQLPSYLLFLNTAIRKKKQSFLAEQKRSEKAIAHSLKKLNEVVERIGKKEVAAFEKKMEEKKQALLDDYVLEPSHLHAFRKQLKKEQYVYEGLSGKTGRRQKKMTDALGAWHDCRVMVAAITSDIKKLQLPENEPLLLANLAQKLKQRAHVMERELAETLKTMNK